MRIQVQFNQQEGWLTIQQVDNIDEGLYRLAYFFENWESIDYRVADEDDKPVSFGKRKCVCMLCRQPKMMPLEFNQCYTCLERLHDNYVR